MCYPQLYLLRHGQTEWNVAARLQGSLDSSLTRLGRAQAEDQGALLAKIFAEHGEMPVLCSPQGRAQATAQIALNSLDQRFETEDRLREISAGSWDGKSLADIEQSHGPLFERARNAFELMFLSPTGEGPDAVLKRCEDLLGALTKPTVLITHGATLCVLRGLARGMSFEDMLDLEHEQGCVYLLKNGKETILRQTS